MLYRLKLGEDSKNQYKKTNSELGEQLRLLNEVSRKNNIPILIINQMYKVYDEKKETYFNKMVGGDIVHYWAKTIVEVENQNGIRQVKLIKHKNIKEGNKINFDLIDFGIKKSKRLGFNFFSN
jgi:RecA/RadA recombinase